MKNQLILAAVLATFAFAPLALAADATTAAPAVKTEAVKPVAEKKDADCVKTASAEKDGKKPSKKDEDKAYDACVKAKADAAKTKTDAVKTPAPAKTETKTETK